MNYSAELIQKIAARFLIAMLALPCASSLESAAHAQSLSEQPPAGVDPDLQAAVGQAQQLLASGQDEAAVQQVLSLYSATDHYTVAQRQLLTPDCQRILTEASARLAAAGKAELAVQASDAAWSIGGRGANPSYGQTLTALAEKAEKTQREESLYLARRALLADPGNATAASIDQRLSINRFKTPGLAILIGGSAIAAVGLGTFGYGVVTRGSDTNNIYSGSSTSTFSTPQIAGLVMLFAGGLVAGSGAILLNINKPVSQPVSPPYLPALPESAN